MRLSVEFSLSNDRIDKDKNRTVLHIVKLLMEKRSNDIYKELYVDNISSPKDLNFSMYMGRGVKFLKDEIEIPSKKIIVNFSTYNTIVGISLYNAFIEFEGLEIPIKNNIFTVNRVNLQKPKTITSDNIIFKTKSPIVVREHNHDNDNTYYHDISDEKGNEIFLQNLKYQIGYEFPDVNSKDLDDIKIDIHSNKLVKVKHYGIVIPSNICELEISTKSYILEYLYLNGIGSRRSQGFGYIDVMN